MTPTLNKIYQGDCVETMRSWPGTTALAASRLNRRFLGTELNPEYIKIAEKRIAAEVAQGKFL